jgi:hypothetical protein
VITRLENVRKPLGATASARESYWFKVFSLEQVEQ